MKKYFQEIYQNIIPYVTLKYFKSNYVVEFFNTEVNKESITVKRSYALRHKVYCAELGFEEATKSQQEFDEYDARSIGCLISTKLKKSHINKIKSKKSSVFPTTLEDPGVAGVRLILPPKNNPDMDLPCLSAIKHNVPEEYLRIKQELAGLKCAEISRLLILNDFRNVKLFKFENTLKSNYLLFTLFAACFVLSRNLDCAIFMCERKMMLFLKKAGVPFTQLMKKGINHRGMRYPIKLDIAECKKALLTKNNPTIKTLAALISLLNEKAPVGTY